MKETRPCTNHCRKGSDHPCWSTAGASECVHAGLKGDTRCSFKFTLAVSPCSQAHGMARSWCQIVDSSHQHLMPNHVSWVIHKPGANPDVSSQLSVLNKEEHAGG